MTLIVAIILVVLLFGGGGFYGMNAGFYGNGGFGGISLAGLILILLLFWALSPGL